MTSSQRIALNTIATYGRTVFAMALGLFSSRWILQALGEVDFGLMGVVGALILFIVFFNGVTSTSCSRFFAFSIGKGNMEETNQWFNTALSIHLILPLVLIIFGYPVGIWAVKNFFNVPPDRLDTAIWVFRLSLLSAFIGLVLTPYIGMFTAKQRICEISVWGIGDVCVMFGFTYWLVGYQGDAWLAYSLGMVVITGVLGIGKALRARYLFQECKIQLSKWGNRHNLRVLFSFTGWQLFGTFGVLLQKQGTSILLNKFFTPALFPAVNASYGIATQVGVQAQTLSSSFLHAFIPEVTSSAGRGECEKVVSHVMKCSKFGALLVVLLTTPILLELPFLLQVWLKTPPYYAVAFCRVILFQNIIGNLGIGYIVAINANGNIRNYQLVSGGVALSTILIGGGGLYFGFPAISILIVSCVGSFCFMWCRAFLGKIILNVSVWAWVRQVLLPVLTVFSCSLILGSLPMLCLREFPFIRLICVGMLAVLGWGMSSWFIALTRDEKMAFISYAKKPWIWLASDGWRKKD